LCGWSVDDADICWGAKDRLASFDKNTLLILDNCDDPRTNYSRYIPNSPRVSVVLTTRLSDARKYASYDPHDMSTSLFLRLDGLDADSATVLVLKASEVQEPDVKSTQQARNIADVLDHHPLALVVASSLIQSTTYSLEEYAAALATRFTQKELLDTESEQAIYRKVSATLEVSADTIMNLAKTDPSARNALALLDILGFFHNQGVSEDIFLRAWDWAEYVSLHSQDEDWRSEFLTSWHLTQSQYLAVHGTSEEKKRAFRKCRAHLIKLSLVDIDAAGCDISLHSLVHAWARERAQHPLKAWTAAASILSLSTRNSRDWEVFTPSLANHLEANLACRRPSSITGPSSLEIYRTWHAFAWQMLHARSLGAMELCQRIVEDLSGREVDEYLLVSSEQLLGILCLRNGETLRAIELLEHVVKLREKLADDDFDRLLSQHELACAYNANGQTSLAIEILGHVMRVKGKKLPEDHSERLASQHELAAAYRTNGQISRAIEILEHVVKVKERLAEDHPRRLVSQHELACTYLANGQVSPAIEILEHVVRVREKLLDDHPDLIASQHALAHVYKANGQVSRAIEIFEYVVKITEKLADDHPDRLASQQSLAGAYRANGQISRAIEMLEHVVKVQEKLAEDHPSRLVSQHELAVAYWHSGQRNEAECLFRLVVAIRQKSVPADHPDRVASEGWLAKVVRQNTKASEPGWRTCKGSSRDRQTTDRWREQLWLYWH
jgi:tetratricopeptide (TPR) repeat protein